MTSTMWSYEPVTKTWFKEKSMPFARRDFGFIVAHLQIYALGGVSDVTTEATSSCIRYDPVNEVWQSIAPMQSARYGASFANHRGYIWAAGGCQSNGLYTRSVECYDPINDRWTSVNDLRIPRSSARMCAIGSNLYIVGGLTKDAQENEIRLKCIDWCDITLKSWGLLDEMVTSRYDHEVVEIEKKILIIGGIDDNDKFVRNVECFCTDQRVWLQSIKDLPNGLAHFSTVAYSI